MNELYYLKDLVIILGVGVIIVAAFHRFKIPAIAGFVIAGILTGPKGLGLVGDIHQVEMLAEIGVALLLFGIGLELPLNRLRRLWKAVLIGGFVQVGLSIAITYLIARSFGMSLSASLFLGFVVAVSSTAIVLRGLEQRGEIDAPHGRFAVGILIFQDLCVVPMILAIPLLGGGGEASDGLADTLLRSALILLAVLVAARLVVPRLMDLIVRMRQRSLFIMAVLLICVGTAWVTSRAGVSLALGAFLGGLIVAEGEYRHQALSDIIPFKEVFTSLFFVSIGMLLDPKYVLANLGPILLLLLGIMAGKFLVVFGTGAMMRWPIRVSVKTAISLAQIGEFAFVLMSAAAAYQLLDDRTSNNLMAAAILSMLVTPPLIALAPAIAAGVGRVRILTRLLDVSTAEEALESEGRMRNHVIIGGYGLAGSDLAQALRDANIPYVIADLNPENVRAARQSGDPAYFGDITAGDVLKRLGALYAREFVVVINDPTAIERAVAAAHDVAPGLQVTVRTRYVQDVGRLRAAGASDVVASEVETSSEMLSRVLGRFDTEPGLIERHLKRIRCRERATHGEEPDECRTDPADG